MQLIGDPSDYPSNVNSRIERLTQIELLHYTKSKILLTLLSYELHVVIKNVPD